jgi:hypothetical protein
MIRHAMEPVFRWLGPGRMTFRSAGDGPAASVAHDLIELSLRRAVAGSADADGDAEYEQYASGSQVGRVAPGAPVTGGVAAPAGAQTSAGTPADTRTQGTTRRPSGA